MRFVVVTGTGTGVGKTITVAALVSAATMSGRRPSVVKPVQTGAATDEPSDVATIAELSGCLAVHELVRLDDPLAPDTAARIRGITIPTVVELAAAVGRCGLGHDLTFVEGAGGVAVRLDTDGGTLITLARALRKQGHEVTAIVVTSLTLGTLNHTELTVAALRDNGLEPAGLVFGDVPADLGFAERCNTTELPRVTGLPVIGHIPHGVASWSGERFRATAPSWLSSLGAVYGDGQ
ncbi:MAG: dethiobiotin synthase [Nocardioidaceae bacterium]